MSNARNKTLEAAAEWAAQAGSGNLSSERLGEFREWLESPGNAEAFDEVWQTWHILDALEGSPELEELRAAPPALAAPSERRRPRWRWFATAAAAIVVVLGLAIWSRSGPPVYETQVGEQAMVELEDGSVVHLDTATKILTRFRRDHREIWLEHGRVLVDVVKDPTRPFVVKTPDVSATALGTQFQVFRKDSETDVAVVEGTVAVHHAQPTRGDNDQGAAFDGQKLTRGQMARVDAGRGNVRVEQVNIESLLLWTTGRIEFELTPLPEAIAAFNRYSAQKMRLDDAALNTIRVSGVFQLGDIEEFRMVLARSAPVRTYRKPDGTIIVTSAAASPAH